MPEGLFLTSKHAHSGWIRAISFARDDSTIVTAGSEGICKVWRLSSLLSGSVDTPR
jgi:WD40 repeat protein